MPENISNEKLPSVIWDDYSYYTLVVDDYLNMGDMSGGNFSINNHALSQNYCDSNNGDVSIRYVFLNSHTLS